jgi:hypothetical protein
MCTCTTGRRTARRVCRLPGWGWRERASLWVGLPHVSRLEDFCVPQAKPNGVPQLARAIRIDISEFTSQSRRSIGAQCATTGLFVC